MSSIKEYLLPDVGEGLVEAEIVSWKVAVGDVIKVNDVVVEIETAKSLVELPSPFAGRIEGLLIEEGVTVDVGTPIIRINEDPNGAAPAAAAPAAAAAPVAAEEADEAPMETLVGYGPRAGTTKRRARKGRTAPAAAPAPAAPAAVPAQPAAAPAPAAPVTPAAARALAKPPVRKLAKDNGIDLGSINGSGEGGIVTRADVEAVIAGGGTAGHAAAPVAQAAGFAATGAPAPGVRETRVPIKGVRKVTAQAMVNSAFTAPHVTEFITVDVTETMNLVNRLKADREFKDLKVSPLLVVMKALCLAVRRNPGINATWDEAAGDIVLKHYVNLGIAAATPRGLMVPNIKDAETKSLVELAGELKNLITTARDGKTQPADMAGGTISITNVGVFGVDTGTPILNPGEAAILALGAIREQPWVVDGEIKVRWVTQLALSFDHRMVDGDLGSRFLADLAAILQDPTKALVWG